MTHPVFISYARDASREHAQALHQALGEATAFLDTTDIALGDRFPEALVDALFGAKVVVIFAEPMYFTRWYCLLEFRMARTPFLRVAERPGATAQEKADALRGLVIAMPPRGVDPMIQRFPPLVQGRNWPDVTDIEAIAALVLEELAADPPTLRERYAAVADADAARAYLLQATRLPPPRRIGNVPFVPQVGLPPTINEAFVGRADDLWRIHDLLWTERGNPATAAGLTGAIEATGGFGKTRLALEYLYRFGPEHFKGGLFWIDAESDPELQLYEVLQALKSDAPPIEAIRQVPGGVPVALARAVRARAEDAPPSLFIIDNVPEPQPNQPPKPLETWCPVLGEAPVLTTSRTRVTLGAGGSVVSLPIDTLDPASAVDLLTTAMSRAALTDAEWDEIAAWVGYLPLALEVLNRVLAAGEMTPRKLLDLSRQERPSAAVDAAMDSIRHVVPAGALRGITEAFSASYNLLTRQEQYAARLIAWMAPASIPMFVIDAFGPDVFAPGIRAKLRNRSFVTEVRDGSGAYFGAMHRVLGDFIRARVAAPEAEVEVVSSVLARLLESAEGQGTEGSILVQGCATLAPVIVGNWIAAQISEDNFSIAYNFANQVGAIFWKWGYQTSAGVLFAFLVLAAEQRWGNEDTNTLGTMHNLAITRRAQGHYAEAQKLHECVLEARCRILGEEHLDSLTSMESLALVRGARGDDAGAQVLQERVLVTRRRILGDDHPDTLRAMFNLSTSLGTGGNYAGAQALQEHVLGMLRRTYGDEHPDTLSGMHNLAVTRRLQGDYVGARKLASVVLENCRRILGHEHPDTLSAMHNLAVTLDEQGDYVHSQDLHERVLAARTDILGKEHPATLESMSDLALTLSRRGESTAAQALQEVVLKARQRIFGIEHPDTLSAMNNLSIILFSLKDYAGAQQLQEQVLIVSQRILGDEHPFTLQSENNLGNTLVIRGNPARATGHHEHVLAVRRRILGDEHPDTLASMSNLARARSVREDYSGAQELYECALEAIRRRLGAEHPLTTVTSWGLFSTYIARRDPDAANHLLREDLLWIIERDPKSLAEQQRQIQTEVRQIFENKSGEFSEDDGDSKEGG